MTTTEPEPTATELAPDLAPLTTEERLRRRVSMLIQFLIVAGVVVALQFGIMLKVLIDSSK
jgi:hypothetical protein